MSLLDLCKTNRAILFEDYIAFDDTKPFAVQIVDENNKEVNMEVFPTKEEALNYITTYNS